MRLTATRVHRRPGFGLLSSFCTCTDHVYNDQAVWAEIPEADRAEMQRRNRVRLALLPPDRYPHVVEAAVPLTACDEPDLHYQFGVDMFIAGVQAAAGRG